MDLTSGLVFAGLLMVLKSASGYDTDLSCAICRALVDEVNFEIGKVDPKRKIQVGSFRVDPKGNQDTYKKSYARSEIHLLEIFEDICEKFRKYAESTNSAGKRSVARFEARKPGTPLSLSNVKIDPEIQKESRFRCEQLVEEYEEGMIALFRQDNIEDMEKAVCADLSSQCTEEDLSIPMPKTEMDENVVIPDDDNNKPIDEPEEGTVRDIPDEQVENSQQTNEAVDQELLDEYLKDNLEQDSIPADKVMDKKFETKENIKDKKVEL